MGVHAFHKGVCPKVNVIERLEFELAYDKSAVHPFNHYTTRTFTEYEYKSLRLLHQFSIFPIDITKRDESRPFFLCLSI